MFILPAVKAHLSWEPTKSSGRFIQVLLYIDSNFIKFCSLESNNTDNTFIMSIIVSQITSLTIVYSTVNSDADQRKHQSSASLAFVRGIHWLLVNSPHKWPVTRKMFPFIDVIMKSSLVQIMALSHTGHVIYNFRCSMIFWCPIDVSDWCTMISYQHLLHVWKTC